MIYIDVDFKNEKTDTGAERLNTYQDAIRSDEKIKTEDRFKAYIRAVEKK
ncbi:MAG: hypothetical protein IJ619_06425 [Eubacterium sp.]|nr:hypothetical protein [Eubacterium sp.]